MQVFRRPFNRDLHNPADPIPGLPAENVDQPVLGLVVERPLEGIFLLSAVVLDTNTRLLYCLTIPLERDRLAFIYYPYSCQIARLHELYIQIFLR